MPLSESAKRKRSFLFGIFLPLFFVAAYHLLNRKYPVVDEADALNLAFQPYATFKGRGLLEALHAFYFERTKGFGCSSLLSLFVFLTAGNAPAAVAAYSLVFSSLLFFYLNALFSYFLNGWRVVIAVWFVSTVPWLLQNAYGSNPESAWLTAAVATLHYGLSKRWVAAAFWLGLALLNRPVEALMALMAAAPFLIQKIKPKELRFFGAAGALMATVLSASYLLTLKSQPPELNAELLPPLLPMKQTLCLALVNGAFIAALGWAGLRGRIEKNWRRAVVLLYSIVTLWYLPGVHRCVWFSKRATFSEFTELTGGRFGRNASEFYLTVFNEYLFWIGPLLVAAALVELRKKKRIVESIFAAAALMGVPVTLAAFSYNWDLRYHYFWCLGAYASFAILVLGARERRMKIFWILLAALLAAQTAYDSLFVFDLKPEIRDQIGERLGFVGRRYPLLKTLDPAGTSSRPLPSKKTTAVRRG